jgi:hypothetical protein
MKVSVVSETESVNALYRSGNRVGALTCVPFSEAESKWCAVILTCDGRMWTLGYFATENQAFKAAVKALKKNWSFTQWEASFAANRRPGSGSKV